MIEMNLLHGDCLELMQGIPDKSKRSEKLINKGLFTSDKNDWETPQDFFNELHKEFDFTLDAAASHENAKLDNYYTVEENGLEHNWEGRVFVNPPYGSEIKHWVEKAYKESLEPYNECVVMLIPSRTDTRYWHDYIFNKATDIRFLKGRLKFELNGQAKQSAPFPSAVIVYTGAGRNYEDEED